MLMFSEKYYNFFNTFNLFTSPFATPFIFPVHSVLKGKAALRLDDEVGLRLRHNGQNGADI